MGEESGPFLSKAGKKKKRSFREKEREGKLLDAAHRLRGTKKEKRGSKRFSVRRSGKRGREERICFASMREGEKREEESWKAIG